MDVTTIALTALGLCFGVIGLVCTVLWLYMRRGVARPPRPSRWPQPPDMKTTQIYSGPVSLLTDPKRTPIYIGPMTLTSGDKGSPIYKCPSKETVKADDALIRML